MKQILAKCSKLKAQMAAPVQARGADAMIAVSHAVASQFPTPGSIVIHAGVGSPGEFESENKSLRTTTVIGAASRLVPLKGLVELIRAVASLHLEFPGLRLEIAGAGPERDNLERQAVWALPAMSAFWDGSETLGLY